MPTSACISLALILQSEHNKLDVEFTSCKVTDDVLQQGHMPFHSLNAGKSFVRISKRDHALFLLRAVSVTAVSTDEQSHGSLPLHGENFMDESVSEICVHSLSNFSTNSLRSSTKTFFMRQPPRWIKIDKVLHMAGLYMKNVILSII